MTAYLTPYEPLQTLRASAALPAAGAYDAAPTEHFAVDFDYVALFMTYTRGAAGGAFVMRMQFSPYAEAPVSGEEWFDIAAYDIGLVALNADTLSTIQRETIQYGATGATAETTIYGPVNLSRTVQRLRILAAEIGDVDNPGTLEVVGLFSNVLGVTDEA